MALTRFISTQITILLFLNCLTRLINAQDLSSCPELPINEGCQKCGKSVVEGKFKIPGGLFRTVILREGDLLPSGDGAPGGIRVTRCRTAAGCCRTCEEASLCNAWQWLNLNFYGGICFQYSRHDRPKCGGKGTVKSTIGSKCKQRVPVNIQNALSGKKNETKLGKGKLPRKSFCILSNPDLHMNVEMKGYLQDKKEFASILKNGMALRTWISEVGLLWFAGREGHSLRLIARSGKKKDRGKGFMDTIIVDGVELPSMNVGDEMKLEGGLTLKLVTVEKEDKIEIDFYRVIIANLLDMEVRVRVANPRLQTPEDAETHINLGIDFLKGTSNMRGLYSQIFQKGKTSHSESISYIGALLHHAAVTGNDAKRFWAGKHTDYLSSSVMDPDCHLSAYRSYNS